MTVQQVIDAVSTDVRQQLSNSGSDASLMIGWVDRVHKDCLHTSFYSNLNQGSTTQILVALTYTYTLSATDIRRVLRVYDRTFNRMLTPVEAMVSPSILASHVAGPGQMPPEGGQGQLGAKVLQDFKTAGPFVTYYQLYGTNTLTVFPAPVTNTYASTLEVQYEKQAGDLLNLSDTLVIPNDGKDMVVAGVNALALTYLQKFEDATYWQGVYERAKRGEPVL